VSLTTSLIALVALAAPTPPAAGPDWCPNKVLERGQLRITSHWHARLEKCSVRVSPRDAIAPSRSLTYGSDGRIMAFDMYLPADARGQPIGPEHPQYEARSGFTHVSAARVFWLFPRERSLQVRVDREALTVRLPSGAQVLYATDEGRVVTATELAVEEKPVTRGNRGGVELSSFPGLLLDAGYQVGRDPTTRAQVKSTFVDRRGRRCAVKNTRLFRYEDGEPFLRFETDQALLTFLQRKKWKSESAGCRALDLRTLAASVERRMAANR
jgi:hypothetical protein